MYYDTDKAISVFYMSGGKKMCGHLAVETVTVTLCYHCGTCRLEFAMSQKRCSALSGSDNR